MAPAREHLHHAVRLRVQFHDAVLELCFRRNRHQRLADAPRLDRRQPERRPVRGRHRPVGGGGPGPNVMVTNDAGHAQLVDSNQTTRPEGAFVLLLLQSIFWMVAGLSAVPFGLAGELHMAALGLVTLIVGRATALVAIGVLWRRRWARRVALT